MLELDVVTLTPVKAFAVFNWLGSASITTRRTKRGRRGP
jgi:hypothetical protein